MIKFLNVLIDYITKLLSKTKIGLFFIERIFLSSYSNIYEIKHNGVSLKFSVPNILCQYRAKNFSKKEPETLNWIDTFEEKKILFDIGANIGSYSLYAAKKKKSKVYAFEPSVFNLELLVRNIQHNNLSNEINIITNPLYSSKNINEMKITNLSHGGAMNSFSENYGYDGKSINEKIKYNTLGFSLDDLVEQKLIPFANYIKIDVDGIEHLILEGAENVLKHADSILIEVNENFANQINTVEKILSRSGFTKQNITITKIHGGYNQIWSKNNKI